MDFKHQTVGLCWCFCNFPYKTFVYLIFITNTIRAIIYAASPFIMNLFYSVKFF